MASEEVRAVNKGHRISCQACRPVWPGLGTRQGDFKKDSLSARTGDVGCDLCDRGLSMANAVLIVDCHVFVF